MARYMHTEISIAMHSSIQTKLRTAVYCAAIIQGIIIRQTFILSDHQYALIEQSPQCAYYMAKLISIYIVSIVYWIGYRLNIC